MVLIAIVFSALGTVIGSLLKDMQGFQLTMNFLVLPIFFLSGALYPLDTLPAGLLWPHTLIRCRMGSTACGARCWGARRSVCR